MACRLGVGEGAVGKTQRIVDSPEHPQCQGVENLPCGARILAKPAGEIAMARLVIELDGLLKMVMGAGKIAELKAGAAGNVVHDQGLGAIRLGCASRRKSSAISRIGAGSPRVKCPPQRL